MKKLTMYFSNICILKKFEERALNNLIEKLKAEGVDLQITYFGIGHEYYMSEYFKINPAVPDIIISTALEVFEDGRIYSGIEPQLAGISGLFPLKECVKNTPINYSDKLLPFLVIPMVFSYLPSLGSPPESIEELVAKKIPVAYGGINNSGAKCIIKLIENRFGAAAAREFILRSRITNMPIQAFNEVRKRACPLALVPSVYAVRADGEELKVSYPKEAPALPSYIAVGKNNTELATRALKLLLTPEFCNGFVTQGELFCCLEGSADSEFVKANNYSFAYPEQSWLKDGGNFYEMYSELVVNK